MLSDKMLGIISPCFVMLGVSVLSVVILLCYTVWYYDVFLLCYTEVCLC
jgi:hypothetical protein